MASHLGVSGSGDHPLREHGTWRSQKDVSGSFKDEFEDIQREKDYFASVIRNFRNGMLTTDNDLNIVFCNLTVERLLGFTTEELQAMKLSDLIRSKETTVHSGMI